MTQEEISALVAEGAKLDGEVSKLEGKKKRLDAIKATLRDLADGKDAEFDGANGAKAIVKSVADSLARSISPALVPMLKALAGRKFGKLFASVPVKGFELEAYKQLEKKEADSLVALLKVRSTPRVSFA